MTSILLLGAGGQVGFELRRVLPPLGDVTALNRNEADFSRPETLRQVVRMHRPQIIVNAAAYTAVDKAESDAQAAFAVNADAPGILAEEAEALDAILVHYSTDYVFNGSGSAARAEADATGPLSVYGQSKLDGEKAVARARKHLVFRTSWVFGYHGHNFVKTMLRLAGERDSLRVVADQIGAPTSASFIAEATAAILSQVKDRPATDAAWGLYHLVAAGETSWNGFARHVIGKGLELGLPLKAGPEAVQPITSAEFPTPARRPANSRLDTRKLQSAFALTPPHWTRDVDLLLARLVPEMLK